jgi:hypothetical protein
MTIEEAQHEIARLKVAYPNSKPFDQLTSEVYAEAVMRMNLEDFRAAATDLRMSSKFFPSLQEINEAVDYCKGRRLAFDESRAREKRLTAGQDAIMDPKSDIHKNVVGPHHDRFLRLLRGQEKFLEAPWMKKRKAEGPKTENGYVPISDAERRRRTEILREQASTLLAGEVKL